MGSSGVSDGFRAGFLAKMAENGVSNEEAGRLLKIAFGWDGSRIKPFSSNFNSTVRPLATPKPVKQPPSTSGYASVKPVRPKKPVNPTSFASFQSPARPQSQFNPANPPKAQPMYARTTIA